MEIEAATDPTVARDPESLQMQKPIKRLLTPFISKTVPPLPSPQDRKTLPIHTKNLFSRFFLTWLIPMLNKGYRRTLLQQDLWRLGESDAVQHNYAALRANLDAILSSTLPGEHWPKHTLAKAIFLTYRGEMILAVVIKCVANASISMTPYLSRYLIQAIETKAAIPDTPVHKGIGYAIGLTLMMILNGILTNQFFLFSKFIGAKTKIALNKALLEKSLVASHETRYKFPNGKVVSMMNADLERIDLALSFLPVLLAFPIPIIIGVALLIHNIGVSALTGVAVVILMIFCMGAPAGVLMSYRKKANLKTDERITLTREVLLNMKMVKFYSWEDAYQTIIRVVRSKEVVFVLKMQIMMAVIFSVAVATPGIVSMVSFIVLDKIGSGTPATIFSSLALFNVLSNEVINFPICISYVVDALASIERLTQYLESSEVDPEEQEKFFDSQLITDDKVAVKIVNASFEWDVFREIDESAGSDESLLEKHSSDSIGKRRSTSSKTYLEESKDTKKDLKDDPSRPLVHTTLKVLDCVNLEIKKGEFIVITGTIASGKSSLLASIFGLTQRTSGSIGVNGSMIFTGEPWVQNSTFRDNITFGMPYDEFKYQQVIKACCLGADLGSFQAGDLTEIGERGVTLSGGQKARLNLARAIYADKDIVLLDDILSAVDANVGKKIIDECLSTLISDKTRILATHQLSLINSADKIVFLNGNGIVDFGTEAELRMRNSEFVELMEYNSHSLSAEDQNTTASLSKKSTQREEDSQSKFEEKDGLIIADEERAINSIPLDIYKKYIQAGNGRLGIFAFPLLVLLVALSVFMSLFANVWLSFWIGQKWRSVSEGTYIGLYVLWTLLTVVFVCFEFGLFGYMIVEASKVLNLKAMQQIIHTPMSFIDTTPLGRILNRFARDTTVLDNEIDLSLKLFVHLGASAIGILILAVVYIPWFAIAIPFLLIIFTIVTNYYQASAREVKRLEAINKSFILNNFNETLNGIETIKAYDQQQRFVQKNNKFSDSMNEVYFVVIANQRWVSVNLDTLAAFIVLIITLLTVCGVFSLSPSSAGLLTSYMIDFSMLLSAILVFYAELENDMNSVERICHYAYDLDQEAPYRIVEMKPPPEWPTEGAVEFKNVSLRYRENLPLIFNKLSFKIDGGKKVGICGRTGAGKSSLMTALYRIVELECGSIEIDGVDTSKLGLFDLRSKLSIIPQDPVLFKGTIRKNLDPFAERTDFELWDALRRSGVFQNSDYEVVKGQNAPADSLNKFHLDALVSEDGSNFSLGEKQLIALARALVRNTKILIMDEATSSVDYETDALIQSTIQSEFKHCTVLCIAHRLRTILKNDLIIVLEKGELEEIGAPLELFELNGVFREMCESSGIKREDF